jgi:hypothetical protein
MEPKAKLPGLSGFPWFAGLPWRVDLLGRSLPVARGTDPARAIRDYLAAGRTTSARALAAKATVLIDPAHRPGEIVWPTDGGQC